MLLDNQDDLHLCYFRVWTRLTISIVKWKSICLDVMSLSGLKSITLVMTEKNVYVAVVGPHFEV